MLEKIRNLFMRNLGLKVSALLFALIVWAVLAGKERTYTQKTLQIPVEVANIAPNIDIKNIRPEWIQITVLGNGSRMVKLTAEDFLCRIDLQNVTEMTKLSFFSEDLLVMPKNISLSLVSIHPKMIEVAIEEFITRDIPVKVRFKGKLPAGLQLAETRIIPERITLKGSKSQINHVQAILTEEIDLSAIRSTVSRHLTLIPDKYVPLGTTTGVDVTLIINPPLSETKPIIK